MVELKQIELEFRKSVRGAVSCVRKRVERNFKLESFKIFIIKL